MQDLPRHIATSMGHVCMLAYFFFNATFYGRIKPLLIPVFSSLLIEHRGTAVTKSGEETKLLRIDWIPADTRLS